MWFEPGGPSRAASPAWSLGDLRFVQPWRVSLKALAGLWRRAPGRSRVQMTALSEEWLRQHETEAAKHQENA